MKIFFEDWNEIDAFLDRLPSMRCPACGASGAFGRHSFIHGLMDDSQDNDTIRARRIRCRPHRCPATSLQIRHERITKLKKVDFWRRFSEKMLSKTPDVLQREFRHPAPCIHVLDEACGRTGSIVHAYILMGNHYHLLNETPVKNEWISNRLYMGNASNLSRYISDVESSLEGELYKLKTT
ncbi:MAG: hypothetical protein V3V05_02390, partial [Pontiella sp.]